MKPSTLLIVAGVAALTTLVAYAVIRAFGSDQTSLAFVMSAIAGSQVGVFLHHRTPNATPNLAAKAMIGGTLVGTALLVGLAMQSTFQCFRFPDVEIPISAIGSFLFPFALFGTLWKALDRAREAKKKKAA